MQCRPRERHGRTWEKAPPPWKGSAEDITKQWVRCVGGDRSGRKRDFARKVRTKGMLILKQYYVPYQIRSICPDESFGECAGLHHCHVTCSLRSAFGQFMSTNKCPKGGVVTRTAGQAGFGSNTSMFHRAWRRKDGLLCDSSQLDISFRQF